MSAQEHIERALTLLSMEAATYPVDQHGAIARKPSRRFEMCLSEDIDRLNSALPSETFRQLSNRIREAWEELKLAQNQGQPS